jgi:hypothetical protein
MSPDLQSTSRYNFQNWSKQPHDINPFIALQECFKWHGYLSFKIERKQLTCLSNYLYKMKKIKQFENVIIQKKSYQIMLKDVYLWILLFLKSTFDIVLSHDNNLQQNWIRIYESLHLILYMQNIIWSLLKDYIHNMHKYTKIVLCM